VEIVLNGGDGVVGRRVVVGECGLSGGGSGVLCLVGLVRESGLRFFLSICLCWLIW
jgi:hypothetical protein